MAETDSPTAKIDYTSIKFPSDRITVGDIRRENPERFESEVASRTDTLDLVVYLERLLALGAYEKAMGKQGDSIGKTDMNREDCLKELTEYYGTYGVAKGIHHTEQLVRDIETQAVAQSRGRKH